MTLIIIYFQQTNNALLSPPCTHYRRRSSVMFSDVVMLHGGSVTTLPGSIGQPGSTGERINICSSEKMTQTGDGNVWSLFPTNHLSVSILFITNIILFFVLIIIVCKFIPDTDRIWNK